MYELPPILQGKEADQLRALRDYLVRLSRSLDDNIAKVVDTTVDATLKKSSAGTAVSDAASRADMLRGLIVKTSDVIHHEIDVITTELHEEYVAVSDYGNYLESYETYIQETAKNIVESYNFQSSIDYLNGVTGEAGKYIENIQGEIRRGFIADPDHPDDPNYYTLGIAISEKLEFEDVEYEDNNHLKYYKLAPGQTFGLYTSTGWQFWISGSKRGWFDSQDGMLHTLQLAAEQSIVLGAGWTMTADGGFGLRYTGG